MATGEAEPLQYTTTVLRVSIHCEGCKKKVKKVLHGIEGVYKVTVDAAQHKVTVTGSVAADALIRRLNKAGKQAALWPAPTPAVTAAEDKKKKPEVVTAAPPAAGEVCGVVVAGKADAKPKEAAKDKQAEADDGCVTKPEGKKPEKDKKGSDKKPEKVEQKDDGKKDCEPADEEKQKKGFPDEQAKEVAAEEASGEDGSPKKGKKKKNKQKDSSGPGGEAVAEKPKQPPVPVAHAPPPPQLLGPAERPHGGFPYYPPLPVMSYNVTQPSASVSYYAPTPAVPVPQVPYGYPSYPHMMPPPPPPEYMMYGPPGMRSSPPQESYNNMFNEENANSCSLM